MDWDKLKIFHVVASSGSFTKATTILNLSQSAISRQIQSLENELKIFANNHDLNLSTIPKFDYNSKKTDYDNLEYKNIAKFYNPYDMMLYNAVEKEIFKLNK